MAFITIPSLRVEASPQRYEHLRATEEGSVVKDGLLVHYPRLATRVEPGLKVG